MALTADQLASLRRMIAELNEANGWTDPILLATAEAYLIDGVYNLRLAAGAIWEQKAASLYEAVKVSESGSTRDMQQAFDHAVVMAKLFSGTGSDGETPAVPVYPRSTKIVRATREG